MKRAIYSFCNFYGSFRSKQYNLNWLINTLNMFGGIYIAGYSRSPPCALFLLFNCLKLSYTHYTYTYTPLKMRCVAAQMFTVSKTRKKRLLEGII